MEESLLTRLKQFDESRPSFPGEHLFTLVAGVWLLARGGSFLGRAAGLALLVRAVTGRDGMVRSAGPTLPASASLPSPGESWKTGRSPERRSTATADAVTAAPLAV